MVSPQRQVSQSGRGQSQLKRQRKGYPQLYLWGQLFYTIRYVAMLVTLIILAMILAMHGYANLIPQLLWGA